MNSSLLITKVQDSISLGKISDDMISIGAAHIEPRRTFNQKSIRTLLGFLETFVDNRLEKNEISEEMKVILTVFRNDIRSLKVNVNSKSNKKKFTRSYLALLDYTINGLDESIGFANSQENTDMSFETKEFIVDGLNLLRSFFVSLKEATSLVWTNSNMNMEITREFFDSFIDFASCIELILEYEKPYLTDKLIEEFTYTYTVFHAELVRFSSQMIKIKKLQINGILPEGIGDVLIAATK